MGLTNEPTCTFCKETFFTDVELRKHKVERMDIESAADDLQHFYCEICDKDFRSHAIGRTHMKQFHPSASNQTLFCPGCRQTFGRLGGLIAHYETDQCPVIDSADIEARRDAKLAFTRQLNRLNEENGDAPSKKNVDFSWCLGGDEDWEPQAEVTLPPLFAADMCAPVREEVHQSSHITRDASARGASRTVSGSVTSTREPVQDVRQVMEDQQGRDIKKWRRTYDPTSLTFCIDDYWDNVAKQYACPHQWCTKSFPRKGQFINHLNSAAHRKGISIYCPHCMRKFVTVAALAHHAESQSRRCKMRHTDIFKIFIDQLSAGTATVAGRHDDMTLRFATTAASKKEYGAQAVEMDESRKCVLVDVSNQPEEDAEQEKIDGVTKAFAGGW